MLRLRYRPNQSEPSAHAIPEAPPSGVSESMQIPTHLSLPTHRRPAINLSHVSGKRRAMKGEIQ
jgi:hypothetical protein